MFEKLDQANRLNDSGAYPYLRSHPLTTERVAEAQSRQGMAANPAARVTRPEHPLMQARARVLMDPAVQSRRRLQDLDRASAQGPQDRLGALYAGAYASLQLRDFARAGEALAAGDRLLADGAFDARSARLWALLGVELALAQGDAAAASKRLAALPDDASRPRMLMEAQVALGVGDAARLRRHSEVLQAWVSGHRLDALAWSTLSACAERQGQTLRSVRAQAESRAALGDLNGAIDRLRAGQRLARSGGATDFIESSVIDSRLRELEGQRRQLLDELRARGVVRELQ
jgi:predicted Zn-dependent protease